MQQDRLIEPPDDSAKYYLATLRSLDPNNPGLAAATTDLGTRLTVKARRALTLAQYDAARSWLDEAAALGFNSPESAAVKRDLDTAIAQKQFTDNIVAAGELTLVNSVTPKYPAKAEVNKVQGWVELDFTVTDSGTVKDVAVHAAEPAGVFDGAAVAALAQWRFKPVLRDSKPVPQRARIRIRFTLAG
jgi:TonB family protein